MNKWALLITTFFFWSSPVIIAKAVGGFVVTVTKIPLRSTVEIADVFNRQLKNTSVLPLEKGPIIGHIEIMVLSTIRLFRLQFDRSVAIHAERSPGKLLFSVDLSNDFTADLIQAQGVSLSRTALFGFNSNLTDLDLILPSSSRICSIIVPQETFEFWVRKRVRDDALVFLSKFNVLANETLTGSNGLVSIIRTCWDLPFETSPQYLEGQLLSLLIECLVDNKGRKVASPLKRQERHSAALNMLSIVNSMPERPFEVQNLSEHLFQSRTSLFNACKEKFGMSPLRVIRIVKLHQVRHALLDAEFCLRNNLYSVSDVSRFFGFASRSHFAKYYRSLFMESPSETLASRRKADKLF